MYDQFRYRQIDKRQLTKASADNKQLESQKGDTSCDVLGPMYNQKDVHRSSKMVAKVQQQRDNGPDEHEKDQWCVMEHNRFR